jgi:formylglycine-generating enzyme required for sulfatase activity
VGVTFLEETFAATTAPPEHRLHQRAARAVLKALLPEQGSEIKGGLRAREELRAASGYAQRPGDFDRLLRILDGDLRLITPAAADGGEDEASREAGPRSYQLTHDYLVPSLREWLTRKQRETRRGRAELRLAERAAFWQSKPEHRLLPSAWEWLTIRLLTRPRDWTPPQRQMMQRAARFHALRGLASLLLLLLLAWCGYEVYGGMRAESLVANIVTADTKEVAPLLQQVAGYRRWARPHLLRHIREDAEESKAHLHASLALLPVDEGQAQYLYQRLLQASPTELPVIRAALLPERPALRERLWGVLEDRQAHAEQRFRAACALAAPDVTEDKTNRNRWQRVAPFVADQLLAAVQQNPNSYPPLLETLRPVRASSVAPLSAVFRSEERADGDRSWAANFLGEYAAPKVLADLLLDANATQFAVLWPRAEAQRQQVVALCAETLATPLEQQKEADKERLGKRQANAAVALLRLGQGETVWPVLRHRPDPRARSYLIHRLGPLRADPLALLKRLEVEEDLSVRRALLLSLGEFGPEQLPPAKGEELLPRVWQLYQEHADPGLHGAAEWLLRQWQQQDQIKEAQQQWAKDEHLRHQKLAGIAQELAKDQDKAGAAWYVNGQGQTMVVIPGPVQFLMGSPTAEAGREGETEGNGEMPRRRRIGRTFVLAAKEVTIEEFRKCPRFKDFACNKTFSPTPGHPVNKVSWYEAAEYCNWLSQQEGIAEDQWCYLPNQDGKFAAGMRMRPNYLSLAGYRLPTEAEWEFACRAGALTSRSYGETEELLARYAWYAKNSQDRGMLPPGSLKPNDLGLFDLCGNALEWCQDGEFSAPQPPQVQPAEDDENPTDATAIANEPKRALRGGSFGYQALFVRTAFRYWYPPAYHLNFIGFRPARTFR